MTGHQNQVIHGIRVPVRLRKVEILSVLVEIVENILVGQRDERTVVVDDEVIQIVPRHDKLTDGGIGIPVGVVGFGELQRDVEQFLHSGVALKDGVVDDLAVGFAGARDELIGVGSVRRICGRLDAEGAPLIVKAVKAVVGKFVLFLRFSRHIDIARCGRSGCSFGCFF